MTTNNLPYFGQINLIQLEEYYKVETLFNGNKLSVDLNFENKTLSEENSEKIRSFLNSIEKFEIQNKNFIEKDFNNEGETVDYENFYLEELDEEELEQIIENNSKSKEDQIIQKLKLIRVGLYPDGKFGEDYYGVFDYSINIDGEPCNQLLVVKTNEKGDLDHITWESYDGKVV